MWMMRVAGPETKTRTTRFNPFGVDPARDLHHQPAPKNVPLANENLLFEGYDPQNKILFYHHMGLIADDTTLWQGDFCLALMNRNEFLYVD